MVIIKMKVFWALFIVGQLFSVGNMNYQQERGMYETNDLIYGKHPKAHRIYKIKALESVGVYGATKLFPKYEKHILIGANCVVWGFIYSDKQKGIKLGVVW